MSEAGPAEPRSRELRRELHTWWKPVLSPLGYAYRGGLNTYVSVDHDRWKVVGLQLDKYGWQPWAGGVMYLGFHYFPDADRYGPAGPEARWAALASEADLLVARQIQEQVVASAGPLRPIPGRFEEELLDSERWHNEDACLEKTYTNRLEIGLRYRTLEHVGWWGEFFASRLPGMLATFTPDWTYQPSATVLAQDAQWRAQLAATEQAWLGLGLPKTVPAVQELLRQFGEDELADWLATLGAEHLQSVWGHAGEPDPARWREQMARAAKTYMEGTARPLKNPVG